MPKSNEAILEDAQKFYVSKGYGSLPTPLTPQALAADKQFCDFHVKYSTAFKYYEGNYPDAVIPGHLGGIDFNKPVELVTIPAGQKHTQTQVAWGAKGNYYSTSKNTPEMMGIAPEGKRFDPDFVPPHMQTAHNTKIEEVRTKMMDNTFKTGKPYVQDFPTLPYPDMPKQTSITKKALKTYEAAENVAALKSSAKEIKDTWSVPNKEILCKGGGVQLYLSHKENEKMKQIDLGAHDKPEEVRYTRPT